MKSRWPKKSQWQQFFKILTLPEKITFLIFLFLFLSSGIFLLINFYFKNTKLVPAKGGEFIEGVIGVPRYINPIYAPFSDVDMDLTELIFSGLMKYGGNRKIEPDLAEDYQILEDGKVYQFQLRDNLFWHDGTPLTVDDIIFTIETIQNPEIKSLLRTSWLGVEMEKISDNTLRFKLKNSSAVFLENCTLKIIPKHVWANIPPSNFSLTLLANLNPVGSGPYKFASLLQNKEGKIVSLDLIENPYYYSQKPYLPKISFRFYDKPEEVIRAFRMGEIKGFGLSNIKDLISNLKDLNGPSQDLNLSLFSLPRYFAVFFNLKNSKVLAEKDVRIALNYATNKKEFLTELFLDQGKIIDSPILPAFYGFEKPEEIYPFDLEKGKEILEGIGFKDEDGDGFREKIIKKEPPFQFKTDLVFGLKQKDVEELQKCLAKDPEIYPEGEVTGYFGQKTKEAVIKFQEKYKEEILKPAGLEKGSGEVRERTRKKLNEICFEKPEEKIPLRFSLITGDSEVLVNTARILKKQWEKLGVEIEIKTFNQATLEREVLRKRQFDAILFGETLRLIPDPFPFWHSSQRGELGLNLSNYENKKVDLLLEEERKSLDEKERKEKLEEFQDILIKEAPAVFLYSPNYIYLVSKEIQGLSSETERLIVDPSKRFLGIENWYLKTKRVWMPSTTQ